MLVYQRVIQTFKLTHGDFNQQKWDFHQHLDFDKQKLGKTQTKTRISPTQKWGVFRPFVVFWP